MHGEQLRYVHLSQGWRSKLNLFDRAEKEEFSDGGLQSCRERNDFLSEHMQVVVRWVEDDDKCLSKTNATGHGPSHAAHTVSCQIREAKRHCALVIYSKESTSERRLPMASVLLYDNTSRRVRFARYSYSVEVKYGSSLS